MRLLELELLRWGAFENRRIELATAGTGFHVVLGPNEAGKSTTLQAITALLFGVDQRLRDDWGRPLDFSWRHAKPKLRLRARVADDDGAVLAFRRRRGHKDTLLVDADDERPLDPAQLHRLLCGVDRERFLRSFSLDHASLRKGGEGLLHGRGETGAALFGASLGGAGVASRAERLEKEREEILARSGRKGRLLDLLKREQELDARHRSTALRPEAWEEAQRALASASRELEEIGAEERELRDRRQRVDRRRRARPHLLRAARIASELAELEGAVPLPEDLGERLRDLRGRRDAARAATVEARRIRDRKRAVAAEIEAELDPRVASIADAIAPLHARLASYRECRAGIAEDEAALREVEAEIARLGAEAPDVADDVVAPSAPERRRIALADEALAALLREERALIAGRAEETALLAAARRRVPHGVVCGEASPFLDLLDPAIAQPLPGTARLPGAATLRKHEAAFRDADQQRRDAETACGRAREELAAARAAALDASAAAAPPSEAELEAARARRDATWRHIAASWIDGDAAEESPAALARRFERETLEADFFADRLRREADRVQQRAEREARAKRAELALEAATAEESERAEEREALLASWREAWRPLDVVPLEPVEMSGWCDALERIREIALGIAAAAAREEVLRTAIAAAVAERGAALAAAGLSADLDVDSCRERLDLLDRIAAQTRERRELTARLERRRETLVAFESDAAALIGADLAAGDQTSDVQVERLHERAHAAARAGERAAAAAAALAEAEEHAEEREAQLAGLEAALTQLCAEAGCVESEIDARIADSDRRRRLEAERREEASLIEAIGGSPASAIELGRLAAETTPEEDEAEASELDRGLAAIGVRSAAAHKARSLREIELEEMASRDSAITLAAELEMLRADIGEMVRRYRVLAAADRLLQRELKRLRNEARPVLARASVQFSLLTSGSFAGIGSEIAEGDLPRLLGLREDGSKIDVEGMSDGTRDQLFLALFLALLEARVACGERLPFVLDDVLINFDDQRAAAALRVFAELGRTTQVLLFTHHDRIAELAGEIAGVDVVRLG